MDKKKRITVGLLVSGIMDDFTVAISRGAMKVAKDMDVELVIIPGKYLDRDLSNRKEIVYEYQYNTLFSYVQKENLDAILVSAGSIGCYTTTERIKKMMSQYADIPCILIASKIDGYVSVNYDNGSGIREAMDCLIRQLNCKKIGMIGGPDNNTDARERKEIFKQMLEDNSIPYSEELFAEGVLSRHSKEAFETLLEKNPDIEAVFCVNDDTAVGFYDALRERNLQPGKQIKVFGYDNILLAAKLKPALSTIWADPVKLGESAMEMALEMLQGEDVESRVLPTKFIRRNSFGATKAIHKDDDSKGFDKEYIDKYFEEIFYQYKGDETGSGYKHIRIVFRELMQRLIAIHEQKRLAEEVKEEVLSAVDSFLEHSPLDYADMENLVAYVERLYRYLTFLSPNVRDIFIAIYRKLILAVDQRYGELLEVQEENNYNMKLFVKDTMEFEKGNDQSYMGLLTHLDWLDIKNAYIYIFEKPVMHLNQEEVALPDSMYLKAVLNQGVAQSVLATKQKVCLKDMFSNDYIKHKGKAKVLLPLFSNEMLYGVLLCDMTEKLFEHGDFLVNQMGAAVKMIELLKANDRIQRQLEESLITLKENNIALDNMSKLDGLTGILNRRGFYQAAEEFLEENRNHGGHSIVAYIDMNNLKIVNDRYGHDEGDFSIRKISEVLTKVVGKNGVAGRIGGDEFAVIMRYDASKEKSLAEEIHTRFSAYNRTSPKPYVITVSVGSYVVRADLNTKLKEALTFADEVLYQEKKRRVKSVAKTSLS